MPLFLAAFVAGDIAVQELAQLPAMPCLVLLALAAVACAALAGLAWQRRVQRASARLLGVILGIAAAALAGLAWAGASAVLRMEDALAPDDEGRELRIRGVVASLPLVFEGGTRFIVDVDDPRCAMPAAAVPALPVPRSRQTGPAVRTPQRPAAAVDAQSCVKVPKRIALTWYAGAASVLPAQRWQWTVRLHRPQGLFNPAGFDAEAWMLEQGIRAQGSVRTAAGREAPRLLDEWVLRPNALIDRARCALREQLEQRLQGRRYAGVIVALVMGDQSGIAQADWSLFNRTGISHLVSISGLHITMIAALVALLAGALWRRWAWMQRRVGLPLARALAAMGGALAYCLLAGWGVPAQRTFLMLSVVAVATCARVRLPAPTVLALAAAMVCLWDPWAVLAAGFWLSFGAVACIFLAADGRLAPSGGWRGALREGLRLQAAITIGQVPLTLAIFGQVSLVAPVANALAIPLVSYLVAPLALLGAAVAAGVPHDAGLAQAMLAGADALLGLLAGALRWLTAPSWSSLVLPMPPAWTVVLAAGGCAWLLAPAGWPQRSAGLCALLPMFVWPVPRPQPGELWVTALDVGQGMAVVLETAQAVVVFDTGPRYSPDADAGSRVLLPYLRGRGTARLDELIVSHQDIDHAGGAGSLLQAFAVDHLWTSMPPDHPLLAGAAGAQRCTAGDSRQLGELRLQVLHPPDGLYAQRATTNARSCVVLARVGEHAVLLTGDVPARQEQQLLEAAARRGQAVKVDLLLAPHHGSHSSSSEALIAATAPHWVSMQMGYRNHFGHPHAEVLARYRRHGVAIERSDEAGAVQWRFGAQATAVERWRRDHARYWHNRPAGGDAPVPIEGSRACRDNCP